MLTTKSIKSKTLSLLLAASIATLVGCGADDDDSTSVVINDGAPEQQQQREEGPVPTSQPIRINQSINNEVKITETNRIKVEEDELIFECGVEDAEPVVHQQFIYVAPNCNAIQDVDINANGLIEREEVEQAVGQPVITLEEQQGPVYTVNQSIPVSELPQQAEDFIFVVYGDETGGVNIPIVCMNFQVVINEASGETTGGTNGGTTGSTTGGTNGGTTGGTNGGTTGGTTGGTNGGETNGGETGVTIQ